MADTSSITPSRPHVDLRLAVRFVLGLTGRRGLVTFQTFDDDAGRGGKGRPPKRQDLCRVIHASMSRDELRTALRELKNLNGQGAGIFVTVAETDGSGRKAANVIRARAFFVDYDEGQVPPSSYALEPSLETQSRNGVHHYWLVDDIPLDKLSLVQKVLIKKFGSDPAVHDLPRVMRLPGFLHQKDRTAPLLVTFTGGDNPTRYSYAEFLKAFEIDLEDGPGSPSGAKATSSSEAPPSADHRIDQFAVYMRQVPGAVEGQHGDEATFQAGKYVGDFGLTVSEAWPVLVEWNARCSPPWSDDELRKKVERSLANRTEPVGCRLRRRKKHVTAGKDLERAVEVGLALLHEHGGIYCRDGTLVEIQDDDGLGPRAKSIRTARLRHLLSICASWGTRGEKGEWTETLPPTWLCDSILAHPEPGFPRLDGISEAPFLRPDGSVCSAAGYDSTTKVLFAPTLSFPEVPAAPTADEVRAAIDLVLDPLADFPFADDSYRSAFLAAVLTPLARHAIDGPTPLFGITANAAGSGKGLLVDVATLIATGRRAQVMPLGGTEEEDRKRITSTLMSAPPIALVDNVSRTFGNAAWDALLTSDVWTDRVLGESRNASTPNRTVWLVTGNNLEYQADTFRRVLPIRLECKVEKPEERTGFRHGDEDQLRRHVLNNRGALATAALTIVRGYVAAGRPRQSLSSWGSFGAWSTLVRAALVWAGQPDPCQARKLEPAVDSTKNETVALLDAWARAQTRLRNDPPGLTAAEAIKELADDQPLADAIGNMFHGRVGPKRLGKRIALLRGRIVGGRSFASADNGKGISVWCVVDEAGEPARVVDDADDEVGGRSRGGLRVVQDAASDHGNNQDVDVNGLLDEIMSE